MDMKKRKQHYVFQAYLSAWTNDNKLWCLRDKHLFQSATINIAQERDFYRIKPLNDDEKRFYIMYLNKTCCADVRNALSMHIDAYLKPFDWQNCIMSLKNCLISIYGDKFTDEISNTLLEIESNIDIAQNNIVEDYLSEIEGQAIKWISLLCKKDKSFYINKKTDKSPYNDEQYNFIFFICIQHFRTKAILERWISNLEPLFTHLQLGDNPTFSGDVNLENLSHLYFWECANLTAYYLRDMNAHLTLLINNTDIPLITSDQPVINLYANYNKVEEVNKLVFYYPLSPNIAILINDDNSQDKIELDTNNVDYYNNAMVNSSYQYIFADSKNTITRYFPVLT